MVPTSPQRNKLFCQWHMQCMREIEGYSLKTTGLKLRINSYILGMQIPLIMAVILYTIPKHHSIALHFSFSIFLKIFIFLQISIWFELCYFDILLFNLYLAHRQCPLSIENLPPSSPIARQEYKMLPCWCQQRRRSFYSLARFNIQ